MTDKPEKNPIEHLGRIMRAEIRSKATPQQAYDAWTDPEKITQWFPDRAEGKAEPGATITWIFDKFNYRIPYEVLIARPAELAHNRGLPRPNRSPGLAPGFLTGSIACRSLRQKWERRLQEIFQS